MKAKNRTSKGAGDVFSDLGFPPAEAENLRIRSAMMRALVAFVRKRNLKQERAARLLGVTQPRVSDLMRGKSTFFRSTILSTFSRPRGCGWICG
jgi:predicted XRE-type DNA-binding protein